MTTFPRQYLSISFIISCFLYDNQNIRPYVVFRDTFYLIHDLLFVNMFSSWMRLEFWSRDVTSQSTIAYFILKSFNNVMTWNKSSVLRFYKSFGCKRTQQNIHTKLWNKKIKHEIIRFCAILHLTVEHYWCNNKKHKPSQAYWNTREIINMEKVTMFVSLVLQCNLKFKKTSYMISSIYL